jgi:hypothetical protein
MKKIDKFQDFVNEQTVKSQSDKKFLEKVVNTLKTKYKVSVDYNSGFIVISDGDDERIELEYKY